METKKKRKPKLKKKRNLTPIEKEIRKHELKISKLKNEMDEVHRRANDQAQSIKKKIANAESVLKALKAGSLL